jgi:hypothetical protein
MMDTVIATRAGMRYPVLIALWLILVLGCSAALAEVVAEITNATGTVHVRKPNGAVRLAFVRSSLEQGEILSTEANSSVRIRFTDGAEVVLKPGTRMRIDAYHYKAAEPARDKLSFSLLKGGLRAVSGAIGHRGNKDAFKASTAVGNIGIRGTQFGMLWCEPGQCDPYLIDLPVELAKKIAGGGLFFEVTDGVIAFSNDAGEFLLSAPEWGYAQRKDQPPLIVREDLEPGEERVPTVSSGGSSGTGGSAPPPDKPPSDAPPKRRLQPGFPLRDLLPLIATDESVGGFSAGLGVDQYAQCLVQ